MLIDSYYFFYMHVYPSVLVCIVRIIVGSWEIQFRTLSCWKILSVDGAEPLVGRPYMLVFYVVSPGTLSFGEEKQNRGM